MQTQKTIIPVLMPGLCRQYCSVWGTPLLTTTRTKQATCNKANDYILNKHVIKCNK